MLSTQAPLPLRTEAVVVQLRLPFVVTSRRFSALGDYLHPLLLMLSVDSAILLSESQMMMILMVVWIERTSLVSSFISPDMSGQDLKVDSKTLPTDYITFLLLSFALHVLRYRGIVEISTGITKLFSKG